MSNQMHEVLLVEIVNITGGQLNFDVTIGVHAVRKYRLKPGDVAQIEEGYTKPIVVSEGRQPRPSILEQLVGGPRRVVLVEDADPNELAALRAQYAPAPPPAPAARPVGRPPKATQE